MTRAQLDALLFYIDAHTDEMNCFRTGHHAPEVSARKALALKALEESGIIEEDFT